MFRPLILILAASLLCLSTQAYGQRQKPTNPGQEEKVRDMVGFLQLMLNTLGSNKTSAADKDVIITESYSRIFLDDEVQIQDDLDQSRTVITNKDVVAYLKDVDFFFENVRFEFNIEKIEAHTTAGGLTYYKVSATRNLSGTTINGETINNVIPRFIEVNFDAASRDLKIASIYTNEFDETAELTHWWQQLSFEWKRIFSERLELGDSVTTEDLKNITGITHLDVSRNELIRNIEPISRLNGLKLLNISGTAVTDLTPIRNLTDLVELDASRTTIDDLAALKYASSLERLNISHTAVTDIAVVEKLTSLRNLQMRSTPVLDFSPIDTLQKLVYLDLRGTSVVDLGFIPGLDELVELDVSATPIKKLPALSNPRLRTLRMDSTNISSLNELKGCDSLRVLYANFTKVSSLEPLLSLPTLTRVYCDQTHVNRQEADKFMLRRPGVLVVYDSRDLQSWWNQLPVAWKSVLSKSAAISISPTKEELVILTHLDSINFGGQAAITDLEPLRRLGQLRVVIAANTGINDLLPLESHTSIQHLDISGTRVSDISILRRYDNLRVFAADKTLIENIEPLYGLPRLVRVYADGTDVHDLTASAFLERNPNCLLVYKTSHLNRWWSSIPSQWRKVFHSQMRDTTATRENLHHLVERESLQFSDVPVEDLSALSEFVRLRRLSFSGTRVTRIDPLQSLQSLISLRASDGPIRDIKGVAEMPQLLTLNISNTAVDDIRPAAKLEQLERLNISGTKVRKLDALEYLANLQLLDCSNSRVRKLRPVRYLSLRTLKCFNSPISRKEVQQFAQINPDCRIVYFR